MVSLKLRKNSYVSCSLYPAAIHVAGLSWEVRVGANSAGKRTPSNVQPFQVGLAADKAQP